MPAPVTFECRACSRKADYCPTAQYPEAMPPGWRMRQFKGGGALLCDWCNNPAHFHGGVSPHLRELLKANGVAVGDDE